METDNEARASVAAGWSNSSLSQAEYANRHGISERTLRSWIARFLPRDRPVEEAQAVIRGAIAKLEALLAGLDAMNQDREEEAACRPAAVEWMPGPATTCPSAPPAPAEAPRCETPEGPKRIPMPLTWACY